MKRPDQPLPEPLQDLVAVDRSALAVVSGGKAAVERDLIALFRRLNDEDVAALSSAVSDGDWERAADASHRILGASRMIGAIGLGAICERIEAASRAGDLDAVRANIVDFQQEVVRVYACLDVI